MGIWGVGRGCPIVQYTVTYTYVHTHIYTYEIRAQTDGRTVSHYCGLEKSVYIKAKESHLKVPRFLMVEAGASTLLM
jgi:hypothetical protein